MDGQVLTSITAAGRAMQLITPLSDERRASQPRLARLLHVSAVHGTNHMQKKAPSQANELSWRTAACLAALLALTAPACSDDDDDDGGGDTGGASPGAGAPA